MITGTSYDLHDLYKHYSNRLLPLTGGLLDQPKAYMQAMEIIESAWRQKQKS